MIYSMTGFGRAVKLVENKEITVEIKSVNHRYFDFNLRIPRIYACLEEKLKQDIAEKITRGKIELNIQVVTVEGSDVEISINNSLAEAYINALRGLKENITIKDDLSLTTISRFSDIFNVKKVSENQEQIYLNIKEVLNEALDSFVNMRLIEGENLKKDILTKSDDILNIVEKIEQIAPELVKKYHQKLYDKVTELLQGKDVDDSRVLTEVALFADKICVDEETVRLKSHLNQLKSLLDENNPVGKKIDFLIQEINREINTCGSKLQDITLTPMIVELKSLAEKIREQVQNIE